MTLSDKHKQALILVFKCLVLIGICLSSQTVFSSIGWVGEVSIGGLASEVPHVLESTEPMLWSDKEVGFLRESSTRPMLRMQWGQNWLPLAINQYTGGLSDWPARMLTVIGVEAQHTRWLYSIWAAGLCCFIMVWLNKNLPSQIAFWAGCSIALDWNLQVYRVALGGTEQLLLSAWAVSILLVLHSQHHRLLGLAVALGIHAKITFLFSVVPLFLSTKLFSPANKTQWKWLLLPCALALFPMMVILFNQDIPSHDTFSLQLSRIKAAFEGTNSSPRETWYNAWVWVLEPSLFWAKHYKLPTSTILPFRIIAIAVGGGLTAWSWRLKSTHQSRLHILSLLLVLQFTILAWLAKDIHHFGVISITLSLWMAWLAAHTWSQDRRPMKFLSTLMISFWVLASLGSLWQTPSQWASLKYHGLSKNTQKQLCSDLSDNGVQTVITMDYDIYGVFETECPSIKALHMWGVLAQRRGDALGDIVSMAKGKHILILNDSPPLVYNLRPKVKDLRAAAPQVSITQVELKVGSLYKVDPL